jgi:hypothetical protein
MTDPQSPQQPPAYETPAYPPAPPAAPAYSQAGYAPVPGAPVPGRTLGIVAFVLSFFVQPVALVLGIVALVQSKKAKASNGWAIAAIIISALGLIIGTFVIILFIIPTFSAAATCASDPTAIVTVWGVSLPCSEIVTP